jgi:hypothetical protein
MRALSRNKRHCLVGETYAALSIEHANSHRVVCVVAETEDAAVNMAIATQADT